MHDGGRSQVVDALFAELVGPVTAYPVPGMPQPELLDTTQPVTFAGLDETNAQFVDAVTGEEILKDRPTQRYGIGVLYTPAQLVDEAVEEGAISDPIEDVAADGPVGAAEQPVEPVGAGVAEGDDFDLSSSYQRRPSSLAVSLLAAMQTGDTLVVSVTGGRYEPIPVTVGSEGSAGPTSAGPPAVADAIGEDGESAEPSVPKDVPAAGDASQPEGVDRQRKWWVRRPVSIRCEFPCPEARGLVEALGPFECDPLNLQVQVMARPEDDAWLLTVALVNRAAEGASPEEFGLFQSRFEVTVMREGVPVAVFQPYPDKKSEQLLELDEEARSLDLLYRKAPVFAVGHGCAATWPERWGQEISARVVADPLPAFETPSITPDVTMEDGSALAVPMAPIAGLDPDDDGMSSMRSVVDAYGRWADSLQKQLDELVGHRRAAAEEHIAKVRRTHERMTSGLAWLVSDERALRAFRLANRSVLEQQLRSQNDLRDVTINRAGQMEIAPRVLIPGWGEANRRWRAFQIGFLLATVRSTVDPHDPDRDTVELIFFPTGGGKTEAYQGLAAFSLFHRLIDGKQLGVDVILRYTLRLLTGQQFLRAAALICAMEHVRKSEPDLEDGPGFSIGIWVGQSITPTTRANAVEKARALISGRSPDNPFLLLQCPWCATALGPVQVAPGAPTGTPRAVGYRVTGGTVAFVCPDRKCEFSRGIPAYVIDEDIYEHRPSVLVATIDKFAMLAYRESTRRIFGIGSDGGQEIEPPNLIIQDELHLISGPLGSVAGLYEAVVEDLCTRRLPGAAIRPKIVASTATIRRYAHQVKALYDRDQTDLFPPHGLDASDSFFARHALDESGKPAQGRLHVGVHAPGHGSMQTTQVRTASALLQAARDIDGDLRDPWWTLLMFFNSLRELGTSVSLFQSDIPDYLRAVMRRSGRGLNEMRYLDNEPKQLTSSLRKEDLPRALSELERTADDKRSIDVCLASNIIEVGVDVGRLSLLVVVGQPKSTSQYIQVTGRVGRQWQERPGLVVTLYGATKPRDRSHFEHFQAHHQRLYADVEPVSVTPFSPPVIDRAAHAAVIAFVRQRSPQGAPAWPMPGAADTAFHLITSRAESIDPDELARVKARLGRRRLEWELFHPQSWDSMNLETAPLMRRAGQWAPPAIEQVSWSVPMSMRDVDAECRGTATNFFVHNALNEEGGEPQ